MSKGFKMNCEELETLRHMVEQKRGNAKNNVKPFAQLGHTNSNKQTLLDNKAETMNEMLHRGDCKKQTKLRKQTARKRKKSVDPTRVTPKQCYVKPNIEDCAIPIVSDTADAEQFASTTYKETNHLCTNDADSINIDFASTHSYSNGKTNDAETVFEQNTSCNTIPDVDKETNHLCTNDADSINIDFASTHSYSNGKTNDAETVFEQNTSCYTIPDKDAYMYTLPASFIFTLSIEEWESVRPSQYTLITDRRKLEREWTNLFAEKVKQKYPTCVLVFKHNRVKSVNSRKTKAAFFLGKAVCKGKVCSASFKFIIDVEPLPDSEVIVDCHVEGNILHSNDDVNKRHVTGLDRQKVAEAALKSGAVNYYYDKLSETPDAELQGGNITRCQTPVVLRKMVSEIVTKEHLHTNVIEELVLLKSTFEVDDDIGYIQDVGRHPFCVVLFCKEQLQLIRKLSASNTLDLYIDATGSIVGRMPNQKRPYLYSVVVRPDVQVPPLSVADMLTTDHTIPRIDFFLATLKRSVELGGRSMNVRKVEIDFSWVFIQSSLKTFNLMNIKQYLLTTYNIIQKQKQREFIEKFTIVHLCSAHMIHDYSRNLKRHPRLKGNKKMTRLAKKCFARLQNCITITETKALFGLICTVMGTPNACEAVNTAYKMLTKKIEMIEEEIDTFEDTSETTAVDDDIWKFEEKPIREVSPYTSIFKNIHAQHTIADAQGLDESNYWYCPEVLSILTETFLPLLPLWSGIMMEPIRYVENAVNTVRTRDTNAPVEGWFKALKRDSTSKSHERPSAFVVRLRKTLAGRLKETSFPNIRKKPTKVTKESEVHVNQQKEKWGRKGAEKRIPSYHTMPKERQLKDIFPKVPTWGGQFEGSELINTCTIDNCLTIIYITYLEDPVFKRGLQFKCFSVLSACCRLMQEGKFAEAKVHWLEYTGTAIGRTTDVYGDEFDLFIQHINESLETKISSKCDSPTCPEPYKEGKILRGIVTSSNGSYPDGVEIDKILEQSDKYSGECNEKYEGDDCEQPDSGFRLHVDHIAGKRKTIKVETYRCTGKRVYTRSYSSSAPPLIFLRVYERVRLNCLPNDVRKYHGKLHIGCKTYRLVGATLHRKGHYVGVVSSSRHGWLFYDGLKGSLQYLTQAHYNRKSLLRNPN